ncbi:O-antigen ligase family protein [Paenibacillus xerothermodurans]|uniref:O-antigen ligase domain-containing protein n=1 Tax=Paenibacillus xerothermodurans TaxID=1977292 RepID=A0A2W1NZ76_PAEXE|nr:O-antigen ligase family protein [Paenibacillus xerothermodurans]PZE20822.1 O-antigen ligase domain-containing protein [Paenibacillus xerothermodurans]
MYKKDLANEERNSILFWLLTGFVTLFLFWAPFQKALFNGNTFEFERNIYTSLVWGFIALVVASLYLFYHWKLQDHRDLLSILVWLLPLTYLISKISAASQYYATNMLYIQILYAVFFILGIYLCRGSIGNRIISNGLMLSGYVVVWFGLFNWLGYKEGSARAIQWFVDLPGQLEYRDAVMSADGQLRLTSTFQYANSYAAFLIAMLLGAVYLVVTRKRPHSILIHGFMLVPIIISFLLTLSRGGLVVLPVVMLLLLPFMKLTRQIFMFVHLGVAAIISLLILGKITAIGEQFHKLQDLSSASTGLWILIGSSAACAVIIWLLQKYVFNTVQGFVESKLKMRYANFLLPAAALVLGSLGLFLLFGNTGVTNLLPESIKQRIENINFAQHSVLERGTFYKDAMKLFSDYPVTGAGGGAWAALYEKYQNNPYVSRQAHNFFIQYLVETGVVGILILIGFLVYVFGLYIRNKLSEDENTPDRHLFFIIAISILVHSVIDFDLSYVFLGTLVFLSLGAMVSHTKFPLSFSAIKDEEKGYLHKTYPAVLLVVSLVMFFISAKNLSANSEFLAANQAARSQGSLNEIFAPLNSALSTRDSHPDYALLKMQILAQVYEQNQDEQAYKELLQLINKTKASEPHNRNLLEMEFHAYAMKGELEKASDLINANINNFPWDITLYERSIELDLQLSEKARAASNTALQRQYWDHAFTMHDTITNQMKKLESLPKEQIAGRAFHVTNNISLNLGQIEYIRGNYESAINFFKINLSDKFEDPVSRDAARWYLAALQKQNKTDQPLFDELVAADPTERNEINKLVNATF